MKLSELRGVGVALVTPFHQDGSVDYPALERVINHVIDGGVQNVVSLGTTGEAATLSLKEKQEVVRFTLDKVQKRVPVIVGIGGNNTNELIKQFGSFPLEEVTGILSVSPYYSKPSEEGLYQHYKALAAVSPKPVILYNVPSRTGRNIPPSVILRLAHDFDNIVAVKEASDDLMQCMEVIKDKPKDFTVVSGTDALTLPQIACGMEGCISVAGNYYAKEMTEMVHLALDQQFKEACSLHYQLMQAIEYMFAENNPAGIKSFLAAKGLIEENLRLPVVPVSPALGEKIRRLLNK